MVAHTQIPTVSQCLVINSTGRQGACDLVLRPPFAICLPRLGGQGGTGSQRAGYMIVTHRSIHASFPCRFLRSVSVRQQALPSLEPHPASARGQRATAKHTRKPLHGKSPTTAPPRRTSAEGILRKDNSLSRSNRLAGVGDVILRKS